MRKLLIILFILVTPLVGATNYYVKNGGDDGAAGTSDGTAWATIVKVNSMTFGHGDSIFFNRGDTWREQVRLEPDAGTSDGDVYYGAYGTGAKPLLLGSKQENSTDDWVDQGSNIWKNDDASFSSEVGNLIFNSEGDTGFKEETIGAVNAQGDWFWNDGEGAVYLYSVGNPATFYTNIECALATYIIYATGKDYFTIDSLDCRYSGYHGMNFTYGCDHVTIKNCNVSYIGGREFPDADTRVGNALQFYQDATYILIENNTVSNAYDAGISMQTSTSTATFTVTQIQIRNNIIDSCQYNMEFFENSVNSTSTYWYVQNNTLVEAGNGWGSDQRPGSVNGCGIRFSTWTGTKNNLYFRNNIFSEATNQCIYAVNIANIAEMTFDYNLYFRTAGTQFGRIGSTYYNTLAAWQTVISDESHGVTGDPLFTSSTDFHITVGSPAIGTGIGVGLVYDFEGNLVNEPPDMGCYAYDPSGPPPPPDLPEVTTVATTSLWAKGVTSGGLVITDGGGTISTKGVCYALTANPTTASSKIVGGTGTDDFSIKIIGLARSTTYHLRAYVTNETGTTYGSDLAITTPATSTFTSEGKYVEGIK